MNKCLHLFTCVLHMFIMILCKKNCVIFFFHYITREAPGVFVVFFLIIALQYCGGLCYTSKWTSHKCTYVPPPEPVSHFPSHLTPLGCHRAPCWASCITQQIPTCYFTHGNVYFFMLFSQFVSPSPSLCPQRKLSSQS